MNEDPAGGPPLRALGEELHEEALRSSARVLILLSLGMNRRVGFTDLLELTRVGKGSLSHHLARLSEGGLVASRTVFTLGGPRVAVEITPRGEQVYRRLLKALTELPAPPHRPGEFSR